MLSNEIQVTSGKVRLHQVRLEWPTLDNDQNFQSKFQLSIKKERNTKY